MSSKISNISLSLSTMGLVLITTIESTSYSTLHQNLVSLQEYLYHKRAINFNRIDKVTPKRYVKIESVARVTIVEAPSRLSKEEGSINTKPSTPSTSLVLLSHPFSISKVVNSPYQPIISTPIGFVIISPPDLLKGPSCPTIHNASHFCLIVCSLFWIYLHPGFSCIHFYSGVC